jgi:hypothetical protein
MLGASNIVTGQRITLARDLLLIDETSSFKLPRVHRASARLVGYMEVTNINFWIVHRR